MPNLAVTETVTGEPAVVLVGVVVTAKTTLASCGTNATPWINSLLAAVTTFVGAVVKAPLNVSLTVSIPDVVPVGFE